VDARGGELVRQIALPRTLQQLRERGFGQLRTVGQLHLFAPTRQQGVVLADEGLQPFGERFPLLIDRLPVFGQLPVVDREHILVGADFEIAVPFRQHGVVTHHGRKIPPVELRNAPVEIAAPFVGGIAYERRIGGRDDHDGHQPYMIRQAVVLLAVAFERLAAPTGERADDLFAASVRPFVTPFEQEKLLAVTHALRIGHREGRLAHRQVVDRVDEIGLARPVVAHETIDPRGQRKLLLTDILEIDERQSFEIHSCGLPAESRSRTARRVRGKAVRLQRYEKSKKIPA